MFTGLTESPLISTGTLKQNDSAASAGFGASRPVPWDVWSTDTPFGIYMRWRETEWNI